MAEYKTLKKKRRNRPKKAIRLFCTIVTHSVGEVDRRFRKKYGPNKIN